MTCSSCIIIGDGPIIEEVNQRLSILPAEDQEKFSAIYAKYQQDESLIDADEACFVLDCGEKIIRTPDSP